MNDIRIVLLFVASIYGTFTILIAHFKVVNERRDCILDFSNGLDLKSRRHAFMYDWLPMQAGIGVMLVVISTLVIVGIMSIGRTDQPIGIEVSVLTGLSLALHLGALVAHTYTGINDFVFIKHKLSPRIYQRTLKNLRKKISNDQPILEVQIASDKAMEDLIAAIRGGLPTSKS